MISQFGVICESTNINDGFSWSAAASCEHLPADLLWHFKLRTKATLKCMIKGRKVHVHAGNMAAMHRCQQIHLHALCRPVASYVVTDLQCKWIHFGNHACDFKADNVNERPVAVSSSIVTASPEGFGRQAEQSHSLVYHLRGLLLDLRHV